MTINVAVILSGCGYLDGAEIRESVLSLLYLDKAGAKVKCFAPDIAQYHVMQHTAKQEAKSDSRNVLQEAGRIARSDVEAIDKLDVAQFDALVIPGGWGVAKNLSTLAFAGKDATILPEIAKVIQGFYHAQKPIGAICIAPALVALALKNEHITLTIGEDAATAEMITALGNIHQIAQSNEAVIDELHRVVTCSAYMRDDALAPIALGIEKCIGAVIKLCAQTSQRKAS